MRHTLKKKTSSVWALALAVVMGCLVSGNCFADDAAALVKDISPPTPFNSREMNLENIEDRMYRAMGIVDAVNDQFIAIGDVPYKIAPGTRIHCRVGSFVGIKVDDRGDVIACEPVRPR